MVRTPGVITSRAERWRIPASLIIPWRYFVTGYPIMGAGDNASFLNDATEDHRGKPVPRLSKARWRRVARRNAAVTVPLALLVATPFTWVRLWMVWAWMIGCSLAGLAWLVRWMVVGLRRHNPVRWLRDRRVSRDFVDPAAEVLCRILAHRYIRSRARRMIELPHGWGTGADVREDAPKIARVWLPPGSTLDAGVKKRITEQVGARLGIPHPRGEWNEVGAQPFVDLMGAPMPPREVSYADLLPAMARASEDEIVVGKMAGNRYVTVSLSADAPHVLMSGAAGTGKSVLVRVFLRQRIERGDGVIITDPKRFSHIRWAGQLPKDRVVYAHRAADLHDAWLAVAAETKRRIELPEEELEQQRRVFVVAEELNAQIKILTRYWKQRRQEIMRPAHAMLADAVKACGGSKMEGLEQAIADGLDPADLDPPATSPAVVALQETVFMGRELRMHMVAAAQRASAGVFGGGGGDVRESFQGGRFVARWDRKLWKMLVDTLDYVACPTGPRGIWGLARGDEFLIFRVPWLSEKDMLEACQVAAPVHGPVLGPQDRVATIDGQSHEGVGQGAPLAITAGVTLAMAMARLPGQGGPMAITEQALRKASQRPGFPAPLAKPDGQPYGRTEARLYDLGQLVEWQEARLAGKE